MNYLVDANILSETTKPSPDPRVVQWLGRHEPSLFVTPIILGELQYGILSLAAGRKKTRLLEWFAAGSEKLAVWDVDAGTAAEWAKLLAELRRKGRAMPIKDSLIAASARQHSAAIATRNTDDYRHAGVPLVNPFAD